MARATNTLRHARNVPTGALLLYYALLSTYRAIVRIDFIGADSGQAGLSSLQTIERVEAGCTLTAYAREKEEGKGRKYQLKRALTNCAIAASSWQVAK